MTAHRLLYPEDIYTIAMRHYKTRRGAWLIGEGSWPLQINLGSPDENLVLEQPDRLQAWLFGWQRYQGQGELIWRERRFRTLGTQQFPHKIVFIDANEVIAFIGDTDKWQKVTARYRDLTVAWPCLALSFKNYFQVLYEYSEDEIHKLKRLLVWLEKNPHSNFYPRQLPIAGIDSKWLEQRKGLIDHLFTAIQGNVKQSLDFWQRCGLRQAPVMLRLRLLDPHLRNHFQQIGDMTLPLHDIANLSLSVDTVYIVENVQTGLAFNDLAGAIVIMGLGYAVDVLKNIAWLQQCDCFYWGDIDTHGFAILNRVRMHLPHVKSLLMDEATLLLHHTLCVSERTPHSSEHLSHLDEQEQAVYIGLKQQQWGQNIRLEQERIAWDYAWSVIASRVTN